MSLKRNGDSADGQIRLIHSLLCMGSKDVEQSLGIGDGPFAMQLQPAASRLRLRRGFCGASSRPPRRFSSRLIPVPWLLDHRRRKVNPGLCQQGPRIGRLLTKAWCSKWKIGFQQPVRREGMPVRRRSAGHFRAARNCTWRSMRLPASTSCS